MSGSNGVITVINRTEGQLPVSIQGNNMMLAPGASSGVAVSGLSSYYVQFLSNNQFIYAENVVPPAVVTLSTTVAAQQNTASPAKITLVNHTPAYLSAQIDAVSGSTNYNLQVPNGATVDVPVSGAPLWNVRLVGGSFYPLSPWINVRSVAPNSTVTTALVVESKPQGG
jgi:hypothetical protein